MLYKTYADLERVVAAGKSQKVIDSVWESYQTGLQYNEWLEARLSEYEKLYPKYNHITTETVLDDGTIVTKPESPSVDQTDVNDYMTFDDWLLEREQIEEIVYELDLETMTDVETGVKLVDGKLLREFTVGVIPPFNTCKLAMDKAKSDKRSELGKMTVTISNGMVFYADSNSRVDIADAISVGEDLGLKETMWKLAEPFNGTKRVVVTMDQLREVRRAALFRKGELVLET